MLKVDNNKVDVEGYAHDILAEFTLATKTLHKMMGERFGSDNAKSVLEKAFLLAFKSNNEVEKEAKEARKRTLEFFNKMLRDEKDEYIEKFMELLFKEGL